MNRQVSSTGMKAFLTTTAILLATACSTFKVPRQCQAPGDLPPALATLAASNDPHDLDALSRAYEPLFSISLKRPIQVLDARLTLSRDWRVGKDRLALSYAVNDAKLRMRAFAQQLASPVFDVQMVGGRMTVVLGGGQRKAFVGDVGSEGSPFRRVLGVDPGDMWPIFTLGARLPAGIWKPAYHWNTIELTPEKGTDGGGQLDGLELIRLDRATGLPFEATWRRGGDTWTVRYEAWGWHDLEDADDAATPRRSLVPTRLVATSSAQPVRLTLEIEPKDGYRFSRDVPPKLFQPPRMNGLTPLPLDQLEKALTEQ